MPQTKMRRFTDHIVQVTSNVTT